MTARISKIQNKMTSTTVLTFRCFVFCFTERITIPACDIYALLSTSVALIAVGTPVGHAAPGKHIQLRLSRYLSFAVLHSHDSLGFPFVALLLNPALRIVFLAFP